jgi:hypothetical protein
MHLSRSVHNHQLEPLLVVAKVEELVFGFEEEELV